MKIKRSLSVLLIVGVIGWVGLSLVAVDGAHAQAQTKVVLRLDWLINAYHTPFILAKEKGLYSKQGMDVEVGVGKGSGSTAQTVGAGQDTFGLCDASMVASFITRGLPIRYISIYLQKTPSSIIFRADTTIKKPQDLIGKTGGFAPTDANLAPFRAMLELNKITPDKVPLVMMDAPTKVPALLSKKIDFMGGFINGDYLRVRTQDATAQVVHLPEWGINTLGIGLVVSEDTLKNKADMVRKFVEASIEGWKMALANPGEAVEAAMKAFPTTGRQLLADGMQPSFDLLRTKNSEGKPIGWMALKDWEETLQIMTKFGGLEKPFSADKYFTNDYIK